MKKHIIVTLALDTESNPSDGEIKMDIERELNCASYFYTVEEVIIIDKNDES